MMRRIQWLAVLATGAALAGACEPEQRELSGAADAADRPEEAADIDLEDIEAAPDPIRTYSGWTSFTSEEYPPVTCDSGSLVSRFGCSGSYCDNVRLYCTPLGQAGGTSYWTGYFSEEGLDYRRCDSGYWMSAIACRGSYCDNISLQCTYYPQLTAKNCFWTGWISEEGGGELPFGPDYYARGVQCDRSYCDNKRFFICQR